MINLRFVTALSMIGLVACTPRVVPTEQGVGFDDFSRFELERAQREAQLSSSGSSIIPPAQVSSEPSSQDLLRQQQAEAQGISANELAQAGIGAGNLNDTTNDPLRTQGLDASPSNPAPALVMSDGTLSDEQSFEAVTERETIESDAERRAAQAAAREQIEPTALPDRPSNTGPNIVQYALTAPNVKGQEWYSRSVLSGETRFQRNCAMYATADDAQRDFLARGGPERDRLGIDPDGDGFACGWDPAPFKLAIQN